MANGIRLPFIEPHFENVEVVEAPDGSTRVVAESDWYDPITGAQIKESVLKDISARCTGSVELAQQAAEELNELFGIPTEDALSLIQG